MKKKFLSIVVITLFVVALFHGLPSGLAYAAEECFYVAPYGDDAASGTIDHPFGTISGAKSYLAAHNKKGSTVYLRGGEYPIENEIRFGAEDSSGVTYASFPGEEAVLTATRPIGGFIETIVNGVKVFVKDIDLKFNVLYHKNKVISTPRYPAEGNFTVKSVDHSDDLFTEKTTYWDSSRGNTSFNADPAEVGITFSRPAQVYARITHAWLDEISKINSYDVKTGKVSIARPATYMIKPGDVYWFENVFEALDSPGEWYLDEDAGKLYYVPFEGEKADETVLYAPTCERLLSVDGCDGLIFERIRFWGTEWTLSVPPEGSGLRSQYNIDAYQASIECDAAVNVENADGISFLNCEFIGIGNTALRFIKNCHDCVVENGIFRQIGSTAIAIYGENVTPDAANANERMSGFIIRNNLIERFGRNTYESTGVHLMYASDSEISHNEIHDGYYTGLSCGWIWGHEYQVTKNVKITDNLIYDIGQGWLSDLGGMYLLGEQPGTVVARNVIYNVTRGKGKNDYGGNGIYTDAGSSYFTIEQNLIYDCAANGLNIGGYNRAHTVRYNVVAFCKLSQFDPGWGDGQADDRTADCYNNVFYSCAAPVILDLQPSATFVEKNNILWDEKNGSAVFGSTGYSGDYEKKTKISVKQARKNGFLTNDIFADPSFENADKRVFTFRPDSPVFTEGYDFKVCDFTLSGVKKDTPIGMGSGYALGKCFRYSDLSAYPDACSEERIPYWAVAVTTDVFPALCYVFFALVFVAAVFWSIKKTDAQLWIKILFFASAPVALACIFLCKLFSAPFVPAGFYIFMGIFGIATALPCMVLFKRKRLAIFPPALHVAVFALLVFFSENTFGLGKAPGVGWAEFVLCATAFVSSVLLIIKSVRRKDIKKDAS